ncbi:MAG: hypothetical protein EZS28_021381 [Streblomastix strix]|uniref:HNH nuclease domain-containing protein n=1 Tax=Streblomastix strix TaxID=222440 RepID=A0A5J4VKU1_9EUKA|nr:MAG: hypothetical protein EZS28_021381 [Streblomastix strix]
MTYLTKETIDERIARVISQKQDYEEITDFPRYRINEKTLEVWDTRLDREVKPHSKKNRAGAYIGMQIQLIDENNKRHELAFDRLVAEQFVSNKNTKVYHLDNDLENCAVDNMNHPLDNYFIDEAYNIWILNEENLTYMELIEQAMLAPTAITWHNTLADLNRYYGRQAQKNIVFLLCRLSLTK